MVEAVFDELGLWEKKSRVLLGGSDSLFSIGTRGRDGFLVSLVG
jgi:hypothetical protein